MNIPRRCRKIQINHFLVFRMFIIIGSRYDFIRARRNFLNMKSHCYGRNPCYVTVQNTQENGK